MERYSEQDIKRQVLGLVGGLSGCVLDWII